MILLDTVTFLWIITGSKHLSTTAKKLYQDPNNQIFLSSVSVWEIVVKYQLGRLPLPQEPSIYIPQQRLLHDIKPLPLTEIDTLKLQHLPSHHQDPFDRMLICQAQSNQFTLLTPDTLIRQYSIPTAW